MPVRILNPLLYSLILIIIFSCNSPKIIKRYKSSKNIWLHDNSVDDYVQVRVNSFKTEKEEIKKSKKMNKTFFDLPEKSQKVILEAWTNQKKDFDISPLIKELNTETDASKPSGQEGLVKYKTKYVNSSLNKNIVFSVIRVYTSDDDNFKTMNEVGDRIKFVDLELKIPDSNIQIVSWNKFENDYAIVDFGSITSQKGIKGEVSVGYDLSGGSTISDNSSIETNFTNSNVTNSRNAASVIETIEPISETVENSNSIENSELLGSKTSDGSSNIINKLFKMTPSASIAANDNLGENRKFQTEILKLTGTLHDDGFEIRQEGYEGVNLKGNTTINIDLVYDGEYQEAIRLTNFDNLFKDDNGDYVPNQYDKLNITYTNLFVPKIKDSITANVSYKYLYRSIKSGDKFIPEYKHRVKFYYGEYPNKLNPDFIKFALIKERDFHPDLYYIANKNQELKLDNNNLLFETKQNALLFLSWILFKDDKNFNSKHLNISKIEDLSIKNYDYN